MLSQTLKKKFFARGLIKVLFWVQQEHTIGSARRIIEELPQSFMLS
jgi:hypothetical protein